MNIRREFLLDKEWKFNLGDIDSEIKNTHSNSYSIIKAGSAPGAAAPFYDDGGWKTLDIPHDYYSESGFAADNLHSHGYRTRSNSWYRKTFKLDKSLEGNQILLSFEGISVFSEIFFNGSIAARSFSAYSEIQIDVTDRVHFGDTLNVISVHIDGFATEGWWYEGAGIYRHVRLYAKNKLHIEHNGLWVKPVKLGNGLWRVDTETTVGNSDYTECQAAFRLVLRGSDGKIAAEGVSDTFVCPADGKAAQTLSLTVSNPALWDIDSPELYTAEVTLLSDGAEVDADSTSFGFRTIKFDSEKGFFLNGQPLKIKGTCNHQDHAGVGVAVPDSIQYYRVRRLKEMGANAYRCAHNLPAREILDACDRIGMLVMDENRRFESRPEVLDAVEAMVRRDRNHPSVIMYSLFNEEPLQGTPEGKRIFLRMKSRVRALDDTRYTTGAMNGGLSPDGAATVMDVVGVNYGIRGIDAFHRDFPELPIIGSENNSAVTTRGCYKTDHDAQLLSGYDEETVPWGQTIRETWDYVRSHDYMSGFFIWTGFDYRGEPTPFNWPAVSSQFGIIDTCGFPKDSYYFNQACFLNRPMMYVMPHWNHAAGETVRIMTVTNCEEAELFLNGISLGRKVSDVCTQLEWQVEFTPGTLSAVGYIGGHEAARYEVKTTGKPVRLSLRPDRSYIADDGMDTVPLNVCALDADGNIVPEADCLAEFTVEGDGRIIGVGNGDPCSHERDDASERKLYKGWCQALLQSSAGTETLRVTVSANGLESDFATFDIKKVKKPDYIYAAVNRQITGWRMTPENLTDKPDALLKIADDDMNSLEPVSFGNSYQQGFTSGWRLYRTSFTMPDIKAAKDSPLTLRLYSVVCSDLELWYARKLIYSGVPAENATVDVRLEALPGSENELRLLIRAVDGKMSGIRRGVRLL